MRWKLAGDDGGQGSLFSEEELVDRHVGVGDYAGLEFLHVKARKIINEVPAVSRVPFRWTINAYRGCSHSCVYCLAPETPVLLGDGGHRPVADLRVGDVVYGTQPAGSTRRAVKTRVLAHWETRKPAVRVVLADGRELVASGDHRFLTGHGWKYVTGTGPGAAGRPHLTAGDQLVGTGCSAVPPVPDRQYRLGRLAGMTPVVAVEPLGAETAMFDITTGTGDFIANGVVSHNCFARPTHEFLGLDTGADFDSKIVVKVNAVERLRAELRRWPHAGEHIAMGTNTDPYQRCEGKYHLTQGIIRVLGEEANPFSILTKSTLILRDLKLLVAAARRTEVRVNFSIGTLDEATWRSTEPGTPHPRQRVEAVRRINGAGIPCGVLVAPIIPGMSDAQEQIEQVTRACVEAGAVSVSAIPLHLRPGVHQHWMAWLRQAHPDLVPMYTRRYPKAYLPSAEQEAMSATVRRVLAEVRGEWSAPTSTRMRSPGAGDRPARNGRRDRPPEEPGPEQGTLL